MQKNTKFIVEGILSPRLRMTAEGRHWIVAALLIDLIVLYELLVDGRIAKPFLAIHRPIEVNPLQFGLLVRLPDLLL